MAQDNVNKDQNQEKAYSCPGEDRGYSYEEVEKKQ